MRKKLMDEKAEIFRYSEELTNGHPMISVVLVQIMAAAAMLLAVAVTALGAGTVIYIIEDMIGIL